MLSHHSNGQDGDFYRADGSVNARDGSFSTNYLELGFNRVSGGDKAFLPQVVQVFHRGKTKGDE